MTTARVRRRAWRHCASRADNLDAYVQRMPVNRFLDERRSGWGRWVRLARTREEPEFDSIVPADDQPADRVDVHAAIAQLPPRQRAVIVLRFLHDRPVEQTAEMLRCTTGTVKSQTSRALDKLRELLGTELTSWGANDDQGCTRRSADRATDNPPPTTRMDLALARREGTRRLGRRRVLGAPPQGSSRRACWPAASS